MALWLLLWFLREPTSFNFRLPVQCNYKKPYDVSMALQENAYVSAVCVYKESCFCCDKGFVIFSTAVESVTKLQRNNIVTLFHQMNSAAGYHPGV